jgi:plastocyanin
VKMLKASTENGFGALIWIILVVLLVALAGAGWYVMQKDDQPTTNTTTNTTPPPASSANEENFANPKKSAHFETSTPTHGSTLADVPADVVIDFNFDLADNSTIKITKDGKDYGSGNTAVDSNKLSLRRQMDKNAPNGLYTVEYNACWPDRTCHDGHHQFVINRDLQSSYEDMRNQTSLTIKMSEIMFKPKNVLVSAGTKVTWVNDDAEIHYVNTDSHPAHTQVLDLNSKALNKGDSFSYTFTKTGAYTYHCSAHEADMKASIVVI